jgi:hypothetical protein
VSDRSAQDVTNSWSDTRDERAEHAHPVDDSPPAGGEDGGDVQQKAVARRLHEGRPEGPRRCLGRQG